MFLPDYLNTDMILPDYPDTDMFLPDYPDSDMFVTHKGNSLADSVWFTFYQESTNFTG